MHHAYAAIVFDNPPQGLELARLHDKIGKVLFDWKAGRDSCGYTFTTLHAATPAEVEAANLIVGRIK